MLGDHPVINSGGQRPVWTMLTDDRTVMNTFRHPRMTCRSPKRAGRLLISLLAAAAAGCHGPEGGAQSAAATPDGLSVRVIPTRPNPGLLENSAAVITSTQPGIVFGTNDSGRPPALFAVDTLGNDMGSWAIRGVRNVDWEAMTTGPCNVRLPFWVGDPGPAGTAAGGAERTCLYFGDVGDNDAVRDSVTVYEVLEPPALAADQDSLLHAASVSFRYAGGLRADVEAMYAAVTGDLFFITKRRITRADGTARPALIFLLPRGAWMSNGLATAELVDSLPIVPGLVAGRMVTDAALSHDRSRLAVRTYAEVYVFPVDPATGRLVPGSTWWSCPIGQLREQQGEGVSWWWDDSGLVLTSEGVNAPMHLIRCNAPRDS